MGVDTSDLKLVCVSGGSEASTKATVAVGGSDNDGGVFGCI